MEDSDFNVWGDLEPEIGFGEIDGGIVLTEEDNDSFTYLSKFSNLPPHSEKPKKLEAELPLEEVIASGEMPLSQWKVPTKMNTTVLAPKNLKIKKARKLKEKITVGEICKEEGEYKRRKAMVREACTYNMETDAPCFNDKKYPDLHKEENVKFRIFDELDDHVGQYMCPKCILKCIKNHFNGEEKEKISNYLKVKFIPASNSKQIRDFVALDSGDMFTYFVIVDKELEVQKIRMHISYYIELLLHKGFIDFFIQ